MRIPAALSADDCEILILRELRRAGIEADGLHRVRRPAAQDDVWRIELTGALAAYGRRWSALVSCLDRSAEASATDIDQARGRADTLNARSLLVFTPGCFGSDAVKRAHELRVALFELVQAQPAMLAAGLIQPGPLPAWVPEFTVELISLVAGRAHRRLLEANQPEMILRELRRRD